MSSPPFCVIIVMIFLVIQSFAPSQLGYYLSHFLKIKLAKIGITKATRRVDVERKLLRQKRELKN